MPHLTSISAVTEPIPPMPDEPYNDVPNTNFLKKYLSSTLNAFIHYKIFFYVIL